MKKSLRILPVTYCPGRHGVSVVVQRVLVDDDGTETPLGERETVETSQPALGGTKGNWGDADVVRVVAEARVEVEPAVEAVAAVAAVVEDGRVVRAAVNARAAVTALRFAGLDILPV